MYKQFTFYESGYSWSFSKTCFRFKNCSTPEGREYRLHCIDIHADLFWKLQVWGHFRKSKNNYSFIPTLHIRHPVAHKLNSEPCK